MAELNVISLGDFVKLARVIWQKAYDSVPQIMRNSGIFKVVNIPANSGNTREFSEIDTQEYAKVKEESDEAQRAQVKQGLSNIGLIKSSLINGETLRHKAMATLNKLIEIIKKLNLAVATTE